jgi:hypothetical protein
VEPLDLPTLQSCRDPASGDSPVLLILPKFADVNAVGVCTAVGNDIGALRDSALTRLNIDPWFFLNRFAG